MKDKFKYELPPPDKYNPDFNKISKKSPATGFGYGYRPGMNKTFNVPGPGAYRAPSVIGEGPKYVMGIKIDDPYTTKKNKEIPSPN